MSVIINKSVMQDRNEQAILQAMINYGPISRHNVAKRLGINKVTVSKVINKFMDRQLLTSLGAAQSVGTSGRKPELVAYNASYGYIVNFSLSGDELKLLVTLMDGRPLTFQRIGLQHVEIQNILVKMDTLIKELPEFNTVKGLLAISIAVFGVVDCNTVMTSAFVDFQGINLADYFKERYNVPVVLENEANLAAIFEQDFSQQQLQSLVSISIHQGIGAGIVLNSQLYRGNYGRAGEVGQLLLTQREGPRQSLRELSNFSERWSQPALIQKASDLKRQATYTMADLVRDYREQDTKIEQLVAESTYYLAQLTAALIAMYDPQMIFFNAPLIAQLPEILKSIQMQLSFLPFVPPLVLSKNAKYATLLGGASLAIHRVLGMENMRLIFHQ